MYLGLDLRGGVHFLLQVDMRAALTKRADAIAADLRTQLRDKRIRHTGISRIGNDVEVSFATAEERDRANDLLRNTQPDLLLTLPGSLQGSLCDPRGAFAEGYSERTELRAEAEYLDASQSNQ